MCKYKDIFLEVGQTWKFSEDYIAIIEMEDRLDYEVDFLKRFILSMRFTLTAINHENGEDLIVASDFRVDGLPIQDNGEDWKPMQWKALEFVVICERDTTWD